MRKFTEAELEEVIMEEFAAIGYERIAGEKIQRNSNDVLIEEDLKTFLATKYEKQNITPSEIDTIIKKVRGISGTLYEANKATYKLMVYGEPFQRADINERNFHLRLIDFDKEDNKNIIKIVNQLEIKNLNETRRPDAIVYINGLPVVVMEFKSAIRENVTIKDAYVQITTRYMRDIPELFKYNCFAVISDGVNNRAGSIFGAYEHFYSWRRVNEEDTPSDGLDSLNTLIHGMFRKDRLLDIIENFIYFPNNDNGNKVKIVASYPQYFAARRLMKSLLEKRKPKGDGKGGTYFGTTGCGKSFIMLFLARLIVHEESLSSPTILVITDRTDLDDQLARQFLNSKEFIGTADIKNVNNREELRNELEHRESGGIYLTTIQKFAEEFGELSKRFNIICISDEAHRTQNNLESKTVIKSDEVITRYGFAKFLHTALPEATYIGFTGTPVDATMNVFGEIVDRYTMTDSVKDGITVELSYCGTLIKAGMNEEQAKEIGKYYDECLNAGSNEYQVEESQKAVTKLESIVGNQNILDAVADCFLTHYENRVKEKSTVAGKCMFVCMNRDIAFKFYKTLTDRRPQWFSKTDVPMCKLIATRSPNDSEELFELLGDDKYRKESAKQFKDINSNFKIAIVVDLWLTGFDVPFLDTIYIDKPIIQSHTMIQTISRVNRSYEGKNKGLIVDFIGIKSELLKALRRYTDFDEKKFEANSTESAIKTVREHLKTLNNMMEDFDSDKYFHGTPKEKFQCLNRAVEFVQKTEAGEKIFMGTVAAMSQAFGLCNGKMDFSTDEIDLINYYKAMRSVLFKLTKGNAPDINIMNDKVLNMMQEAIKMEGAAKLFSFGIDEDKEVNLFDNEYLESIKKIEMPNTKIKLLIQLMKQRIDEFRKVNKIQGKRFEELLRQAIERYNERMKDPKEFDTIIEEVTTRIINLLATLDDEKNSFARLGIDYEEKAFFDILTSVAKQNNLNYSEDKIVALSLELRAKMKEYESYRNWVKRDKVKIKMRVDIMRILNKHGYADVSEKDIYRMVYKDIIEQTESFREYRVA